MKWPPRHENALSMNNFNPRDIKYIVLHCTGTKENAKLENIIKYWKEELKWEHYGYHYVIHADGKISHITPDDQIANGVKGYNANSIHVAYIGGIDRDGKNTDTRTTLQKYTIELLCSVLKLTYTSAKVCAHHDFPDVHKTCPNFDVK